MSNIRLESLKDTGSYIPQKALDGAASVMDWKQKLMHDGRVFNVTVGTLVTGITGGGAVNVPDIDLPEFLIDIPAGTTVIPLSMCIEGVCDNAIADNDKLDAFICKTTNLRWDGTGTCTTEVPICMRTVGGGQSVCRVSSAFNTVNITVPPVHDVDLARISVQIDKAAAGEATVKMELRYEPEIPPYIVGPCMIVGHWGGTSAVVGYAQLYWAEIPTATLF
jgi:hypothetical protein